MYIYLFSFCLTFLESKILNYSLFRVNFFSFAFVAACKQKQTQRKIGKLDINIHATFYFRTRRENSSIRDCGASRDIQTTLARFSSGSDFTFPLRPSSENGSSCPSSVRSSCIYSSRNYPVFLCWKSQP